MEGRRLKISRKKERSADTPSMQTTSSIIVEAQWLGGIMSVLDRENPVTNPLHNIPYWRR